MTTRSANRPVGMKLALWITGFVFVTSTLYGVQAEQHDPSRATTFSYVANLDNNSISVIDTASNAVVATIPVGRFPDAVTITPDGAHAYVTNGFDATVSVIDTASDTVVATIPVGKDPNGVAITSDTTDSNEANDRRRQPLAYVTNGADNTVSVIDTASNVVVATIPVGKDPSGVVITSDGTHVYVTNQLDDSVSVIDTASNTVVATIPVGTFPFAVAFTTAAPSHRSSQQ